MIRISIKDLRGMTPGLEGDLQMHGIYHSEQLLEAARTPGGREALAVQVGVEARTILELANRADLSRVWGVAGVYSDLLEQAGVDTVKELATRNPDNLHATLIELNAREKLTRRVPPLSLVKRWVAEAKDLPRGLEY
jgi:predicted flap endonuclease-1-like 5' DNA nuclease